MSGVHSSLESGTGRYEDVVRISEALAACREPEELAKTLADLLSEFLSFEYLDVLILKEGSTEVEWHAWGKGSGPLPDTFPDDLPKWHVYHTQEPLHIADWNADNRFPRLKQSAAEKGVEVG
jgi:hypothetical protein